MASPKGDSQASPVRFYTEASVAEVDSGGWGVLLDSRRVRTPAGAVLAVPTRALAELIADEWRRQGARIDVAGMTATRLANAALDRTSSLRDVLAEEAARYAQTDLVCYLAMHPAELRRRQEEVWTPLRDWCAEAFGVALSPIHGVMPAPQPEAAIGAARAHVGALSDFEATGLLHAVSLLGSIVLGLALASGRVTATEAHAAARLDEDYQAGLWGQDAEAMEFAAARLAETEMVARWLAALREGSRGNE